MTSESTSRTPSYNWLRSVELKLRIAEADATELRIAEADATELRIAEADAMELELTEQLRRLK